MLWITFPQAYDSLFPFGGFLSILLFLESSDEVGDLSLASSKEEALIIPGSKNTLFLF